MQILEWVLSLPHLLQVHFSLSMKWAAIVVTWSRRTRVALPLHKTLSQNSDPTEWSKHFPPSIRSEPPGNSEHFEGSIIVGPSGEKLSWLNMEQRGDRMSIGYLDNAHIKVCWKTHIKMQMHLTHSAPEGVRPVHNCMKQINISTMRSACWISMNVLFTFTGAFPPFFSLPLYPAPDLLVQWFNDLCTHALLTNSGTVVKIAIWKRTAPNQKINIVLWSGPKRSCWYYVKSVWLKTGSRLSLLTINCPRTRL